MEVDFCELRKHVGPSNRAEDIHIAYGLVIVVLVLIVAVQFLVIFRLKRGKCAVTLFFCFCPIVALFPVRQFRQ